MMLVIFSVHYLRNLHIFQCVLLTSLIIFVQHKNMLKPFSALIDLMLLLPKSVIFKCIILYDYIFKSPHNSSVQSIIIGYLFYKAKKIILRSYCCKIFY